jgi:hypothetical protein
MSDAPAELWPWIMVAALGIYHGVNPAMGWLFAVALGLHRGSGRIVALSLVPIALGHLLSAAVVLAIVLTLGLVVDRAILARLAAGALIAWAIWHALYGHRRTPLVGMQTGMLGLLAWSFVVASAHGAGLMLVPALLSLCASSAPASQWGDAAVLPALAALGLHTAAMVATIGAISLAVYNWIGVAFLRRGWINLDLVWIGALAACGIIVLATA